MKKIILLLVSVVMLFSSVGKITALIGKADIKRNNQILGAKIGFLVEEKDIIKTYKTTKMQIVLKDDSVITIGKNSYFKIQDYLFDENKPKARLKLRYGIIKTLTGKIGKIAPQRFKVETKNAIMGIRGTYFVVEAYKSITKVGMLSGKVEFVDKFSNKTFVIQKGEQIILNTSAPSEKRVVIKKGFKEPDAVKFNSKSKKTKEKTIAKEKKTEKKDTSKTKKEEKTKTIKPKEKKAEEKKAEEKKTVVLKAEAKTSSNKETISIKKEETKTETSTPPSSSISSTTSVGDMTASSTIETSTPVTTDLTEVEVKITDESKEDTIIKDTIAPHIDFNIETSPSDELASLGINNGYFYGDKIVLKGSVNELSNISIYVNGELIQTFTKNGSWEYDLNLEEGENKVIIKAKDEYGNAISKDIGVFYIINKEDYENALSDISKAETPPTSEGDTALPEEKEGYTKEIVYTDSYLSYGYWEKDGVIDDLWIEGVVTPSDYIEELINNHISAEYNGNVLVKGEDGLINGNIKINMDFDALKFDGKLDFKDDETWKVDIKNGEITPYGFESSHLVESPDSEVKGVSGDLKGYFYGNKAQEIGGKFNLNSETKNIKGVFHAK